MALTGKRLAFVNELMADPNRNATEAYKRAGYKTDGNSAESAAARLLRNVQVQAEIAARESALAEQANVKAADLIEEWKLIAFSDVGQILDFTKAEPRLRPANEIPESARRAISSFKVKRYTEGRGDDAREVEVTEFKLWPKNDALEKLGKHLGMFANDDKSPNVNIMQTICVEVVHAEPVPIPDGPILNGHSRITSNGSATNGNGSH